MVTGRGEPLWRCQVEGHHRQQQQGGQQLVTHGTVRDDQPERARINLERLVDRQMFHLQPR